MSNTEYKTEEELTEVEQAVLDVINKTHLVNGEPEQNILKALPKIKKEDKIKALFDLAYKGRIYMPMPDTYKAIEQPEAQQEYKVITDDVIGSLPPAKFILLHMSKKGEHQLFDFSFKASDDVYCRARIVAKKDIIIYYKDPNLENLLPLHTGMQGKNFILEGDFKFRQETLTNGKTSRQFTAFDKGASLTLSATKQEKVSKYI